MQPQKTLTVSVIIPCYNEADILSDCLEALMAQTAAPFEIFVVDNNSTDKTAQIAKKYKGVQVIPEYKQGLVNARTTGMNHAKGEVLARLDADSRPAPDWIATIQTIFQNPKAQAATGTGYFYDAPFKKFVRLYRNFFAVWLNRLAMGHHMLWGSNMAIRRSSWLAIQEEACYLPNIMEDLDIAAHTHKKFGKGSVEYHDYMRVDISARRIMVSLWHNWSYLKMWPRTLALHDYQKRVLLWPAIGILLLTMTIANKYARFYNAHEDRMIFTLAQWRSKPLYTAGNP